MSDFHQNGPITALPLVPNWARVWAGVHDAGPQLMAAVAEGAAGVRTDRRAG